MVALPDASGALEAPEARRPARDRASRRSSAVAAARARRDQAACRSRATNRDSRPTRSSARSTSARRARMARSRARCSKRARAAGISDRTTMDMAGIFEWDIDFIQDVREGDTFTVIYEELWRDGVKLRDGEIVAAEFVNQGKSFRAARFRDASGRAGYYTPEGRSVRKAFIRAPLNFTRISSNFNPSRRHPVLNTIRAHRGVDYAAPTGTPIRAAGDGKVSFRGVQGGYGNTIVLQHGGNITTLVRSPLAVRQRARRCAREPGRRDRLRRQQRPRHRPAPALRVSSQRRAPQSAHCRPAARRPDRRGAANGVPRRDRAAVAPARWLFARRRLPRHRRCKRSQRLPAQTAAASAN